jgi:hypothetical protein
MHPYDPTMISTHFSGCFKEWSYRSEDLNGLDDSESHQIAGTSENSPLPQYMSEKIDLSKKAQLPIHRSRSSKNFNYCILEKHFNPSNKTRSCDRSKKTYRGCC